MARYTADPTQDTAGFPVLPGGDYRFRLGSPKAFLGETKKGVNAGNKNFGVNFLLTVVDGPVDVDGNVSPKEHLAKKIGNRLYYHTQESRNFSKGFILAAYGYTQKEETEFDNALKILSDDDPMRDWSFDPETGECGHAWHDMTNREIVVTLGIQKDEEGNDRQEWLGSRPVPASSEIVSSENVEEVAAGS